MSWEQLQAIETEKKDEVARDRSEPPSACPNDGTPLLVDPRRGGLSCRFDGWHWPTDA